MFTINRTFLSFHMFPKSIYIDIVTFGLKNFFKNLLPHLTMISMLNLSIPKDATIYKRSYMKTRLLPSFFFLVYRNELPKVHNLITKRSNKTLMV